MQGTNTLAYYENSGQKSFVKLVPGDTPVTAGLEAQLGAGRGHGEVAPRRRDVLRRVTFGDDDAGGKCYKTFFFSVALKVHLHVRFQRPISN